MLRLFFPKTWSGYPVFHHPLQIRSLHSMPPLIRMSTPNQLTLRPTNTKLIHIPLRYASDEPPKEEPPKEEPKKEEPKKEEPKEETPPYSRRPKKRHRRRLMRMRRLWDILTYYRMKRKKDVDPNDEWVKDQKKKLDEVNQSMTEEEKSWDNYWWWDRFKNYMKGDRRTTIPIDEQIKKLQNAKEEFYDYQEFRSTLPRYKSLRIITRICFLIGFFWTISYSADRRNKNTTLGKIHQMYVNFEWHVINYLHWGTDDYNRIILPPDTFGKRYTIVMDVDAIALVDFNKDLVGTYMYKRAGTDYFFHNLMKDFEFVLYSPYTEGEDFAIEMKLDPTGMVIDHIRSEFSGLRDHRRKEFTTDFRLLNRDPAKVIFLDFFQYDHPNVIGLPQINPRHPDKILPLLTVYLRDVVAAQDVPDVRPYLEKLQNPETLEKTLSEYVERVPVIDPLYQQMMALKLEMDPEDMRYEDEDDKVLIWPEHFKGPIDPESPKKKLFTKLLEQ